MVSKVVSNRKMWYGYHVSFMEDRCNELGRKCMSMLWYREPAKIWEEAMPLGNGRIGAMVFGHPERERIQVNEESIWYGGPVNRINPD